MAHHIRGYNPETDKAFIYSTMLRGLYYSNDFYNQVQKSTFFTQYTKVLDAIIAANSVVIACDVDDSDVILAYTVQAASGTVLHYAYCKAAWRGKGLVRSMLLPHLQAVTHITPIGNDIRLNKSLVFNPFLINT